MNAYFFNITNEEKSNILERHKEIYDGYVTEYGKGNNQQPLYIQDYANDKNGITVNNSGGVDVYKNININEMRHDGKNTGLFSDETFESEESYELDEMEKDTIGDGPMDLEHGTVEFDDDEDFDDLYHDSDFEIEDIIPIQEQIDKTIDMFKRFSRY